MASQPTDRIDPQPVWPSVDNPFAGAADAFAVGNYPLALAMAPQGSAIRAAATVMCGAIAPGLALLEKFDSPEMRLIRAYALWCMNRTAEAGTLVDTLKDGEVANEAAQMRSFLESPPEIALVTMPGSSHAGRFQALEGFRCHSIQLGPEQFGMSMADALARLPSGTLPRMILAVDAYGPYLPRAPQTSGLPIVFWAGDHDFFFATRHADLARADVIVVNSASEQVELGRHYDARVAAIPGHESFQQIRQPQPANARQTDVMFTGRAFTPYMRDKAQMLFRLATTDEPTLSIEIIDGYLPNGDYHKALARARHVPLFWRYAGGFQTRGIEALCAGARVLVPEAGLARPLLGAAAPAYCSIIDEDVVTILGEAPPRNGSAVRDLENIFWSSSDRDGRFLKFCLFQTILARPRREPAPEPDFTPAEQRGYDPARGIAVYTRIARLNSETDAPGAANFNHAAAAAFYAAILVPENGISVAKMALDFYRAGVQAFPLSLALRFNAARALWTFGLRNEAIAEFRAMVEQLPDLAFDARSDALLSHRVRPLADMFPYGDFFRAAVGIPESRARAPGPREFVASAALAYIAADLIERHEPTAAVALLRRAIERCDVNVAAWRLLARALHDAGAPPAETRAAFYGAANLYPPELLQLLSIGVEAELADGRTAAAGRILRQWVLIRARVRDAQGRPIAASPDAIAAARRHRALLSDWTGNILDRMVAAE